MEKLPVVVEHLVYHYEHQLSWYKVMDELLGFYMPIKREVDQYIHQYWAELIAIESAKLFFPERNAPGGTLHKTFLYSWYHSLLKRLKSSARSTAPYSPPTTRPRC